MYHIYAVNNVALWWERAPKQNLKLSTTNKNSILIEQNNSIIEFQKVKYLKTHRQVVKLKSNMNLTSINNI